MQLPLITVLSLFSGSVKSNSFAPPWTVACQTPLSMGLSRQEYWSGFPFLSPGNLPNPGIEHMSSALQADSLPTEPFELKAILFFFLIYLKFFSVSSVTQLCPALCDPMDCSTPGLPVHHQLPQFTQTHVH